MTKDEAIARLHEWIKPGDTVYTILRHRAASGMTRWISLILPKVEPDGRVRMMDLSYVAAAALGKKPASYSDKHEGIRVGGAGMDMGFHLVYNLGQAMWPKGTPEPHGTRNGVPDSDGGYALKHSWL